MAFVNTQIDPAVSAVGSSDERIGLAFAPGGFPHYAYYDNINNALKHAFWDGTNYIIETVDNPANDVGRGPSIDVANNGDVWISYIDMTAPALKLAKKTGAAWAIYTITTVGNDIDTTFPGTTIKVDNASGQAWIAYLGAFAGGNQFNTVFGKELSWTLHGTGLTNILYPEMVLDSNNFPRIVGDKTGGSNQGCYYTEWNGIGFDLPVFDIIAGLYESIGDIHSIAIDGSDNVYMTFEPSSNDRINMAFWDGVTLTKEGMTGAIASALSASTIVDSNGDPHVAYHTSNSGGELRYLNKVGGAWNAIQLIDSPGKGFGVNMKISGSNILIAGYGSLESYLEGVLPPPPSTDPVPAGIVLDITTGGQLGLF